MKKNRLGFLVVMFVAVFSIFSTLSSSAMTSDERNVLFEPNERVIRELSNTNIVKIGENILKDLNIGVNRNTIKLYMMKVEDSSAGNSNYYKMIYNDSSYISFNDKGNLLQADTLGYNVKTLGRSHLYNASRKLSTIDSLIQKLKDKNYLLVEEDPSDDLTFYRLEKVLKDDLTNKHDFISIFYDRNNDNVVRYKVVNNPIEYKQPAIDKSEAEDIVKRQYSLSGKNSTTEVKLTTYEDVDNGSVKMAYSVKLEDESIVYVDPFNGNIINRSISKGGYYKGRAIVNTEFDHAYQSASLAKNGLERLGYTTLSNYYTSSNIDTPIKNSVATSGFRALYVDCHGDKDATYLSAASGTSLYADDLSSLYPNLQLRFVFLDACSTGVNNNWPNVFKIRNGWGAYIGWDRPVNEEEAYNFSRHFWQYADGHTPIKRAVEKAKADVSVKARPVFVGNSTFYGTAN